MTIVGQIVANARDVALMMNQQGDVRPLSPQDGGEHWDFNNANKKKI